jgi:hypothetical protein
MITNFRKTLLETKSSIKKNGKRIHEKESTKKLVLPYDLVYEYIKNHESLKYSGTNTRDIYNGINLFLNKTLKNEETPENEKKDKGNTENVTKDKSKELSATGFCGECKGYLLIDSVVGNYVCSSCGLLQNRNSINITPEYSKPAEVEGFNKPQKIRGVNKTVIHIVNASSENVSQPQNIMEDLKHFNAFFNIPQDDLKLLELKFRYQSKNTSVSYNGKILGLIFSYIFKDSMILEEDFKHKINNGITIKEISGCPEPLFSCKNCGSMCFTMKDARYHCKFTAK